jgi:hypothetical protein
MTPHEPRTALQRYFSGLTEHAFAACLGVPDPPLIDYVSDLLVRFLHFDSLTRPPFTTGGRLRQVYDMVVVAEQHEGLARRAMHRHIGDYTLFWTGVYPEALGRLQATMRKDFFIDYFNQGKRSYQIASTYPPPPDDQLADPDVLARLSEQFEVCVAGLREVRRAWEASDDAPGGARVIC